MSDSAADALLALLHELLCERWRPAGATRRPSDEAAYEAPAVRVRGLRVQRTLFVHFVSASRSLRLDLQLREYVRAADGDARVGEWLCSKELLRWRLERGVFAEFEAPPSAAMQAELGKLAPPVLARLLAFLRGPEFVRATQTSKHLHGLADNAALWQQFLQQDFPHASSAAETPDNKTTYVAQHRRKRQRERQHALPPWTRGRDDVGLWFHRPPPPPGLWVPPAPFQPALPGRDRRWDLDSDSDVRLPFDQRGL